MACKLSRLRGEHPARFDSRMDSEWRDLSSSPSSQPVLPCGVDTNDENPRGFHSCDSIFQMTLRIFIPTALFVLICAAPLLRGQSLPGLVITNNSFTYDAPDGQVTGIIVLPPGDGPFPAVLISHGKGGSASGFSLPHATVLAGWGFACIGPNYTHAGSASNPPENEGYCPENSRRARRCLDILASSPKVDMTRLALFGHSMGAFVTGGLAGEIPSQIQAACISAGGTSGSTNTGFASPATQEVQGITAPILMFHGTADTTVVPGQSLNLQNILNGNGVPNRRIVFQGINHDLPNTNVKRADLHAIMRAWFTEHGVLAFAGNTAPAIVAAASVTAANGRASTPFPVTLGDDETSASSLSLEVFSTDDTRLPNSAITVGGSGANRTLTFSPPAGQTGTVEIALVVNDGQLASVTYTTVTITIDPLPLALAYSTGGNRINVNRYATPGGTLTATGGTAPYTWEVVSGALPAGVTLNGNGSFSGSSSATGGHSFRAQATDALGATGEGDFSIWVNSTRQGTVQTVSFSGPETGGLVTFSLYLPPGYQESSNSYPVIYHLHGIGGTHDGGQINTVPVSLESAVAAGIIQPCIIVFPDGYNDSFWADAVNENKPAETNILREIIPYVEANYRASAARRHRVVQGFSMGGFGAAKFATKFPGHFACCAIYDGAMLTWAVTQQRHPLQTTSIFDSNESVFNQFSAYHWSNQNTQLLRTAIPIRNAVGALVSDNQNWQTALGSLAIPATFVQTGLPHSLGPLLDAQGANMWEFIAAAMAAPGEGFVIGFPGGNGNLTTSTGNALNVTLGATGGVGPYSWTMASGALPPGVTLTGDGQLQGTPGQTGTFTFTAFVTDAEGNMDARELTLTVNALPVPVPSVKIHREASGNILLTWPATIGTSYQVEFCDDLGTWESLGEAMVATQTALSWRDDGTLTGEAPVTADRRFYRVSILGFSTLPD